MITAVWIYSVHGADHQIVTVVLVHTAFSVRVHGFLLRYRKRQARYKMGVAEDVQGDPESPVHGALPPHPDPTPLLILLCDGRWR